jgi:signal transduction histidine kinase
MNLSLRTKSIAVFAVLLLALIAVYATFSFRLLQRETRDAADRLQQTADLLAAEIDASLDSGARRLETVGQLPGLAFGLRRMTLSANRGEFPAWTTLHYLFFKSALFSGGIFLLDAAGTVVWNEPPDRSWRGRLLGALPAVRAAREHGTVVVSDGLGPDEVTDGPHVMVVQPIVPKGAETAGYLGGIIDLRTTSFVEIVGAARVARDRFVVVTDGSDRVVASTTAEPLLSAWRSSDLLPSAMLASSVLPGSSWRVWVGQSKTSALAGVRQLQRLLVGLGLVLILTSLLVGAIFVRDLTQSIGDLTRHAEIMASGDLSKPLRMPARRDELGVLAATFERMRFQLARTQEALQARLTERDELLRLKEEFLANTSHELRTPLNVISGYAEMLEDGERDPERREIFDSIRSQVGRLLDLFNDLMTLSGANAGRLQVKMTRIDLHDVVRRIATMAERIEGASEIGLVWDVPADLPPILSDELRLEQILANLVTNAIKFTPRGKVALHVRHDADSHQMTFVVSDTGDGIPESDLPYIFDEFRQVDGSMSRRHGGMGLGLAVVKKLVTLLGGDIRVRSLFGFGSVFTVTLPIEVVDGPDLGGEPARVLPA